MTYIEFADTVEERLRTRWPDRPVYRDLCRVDHETPSFFLQVVEAAPQDANAVLVRWDVKLVVAAFEDPDDYSDTPTGPLLETQLSIMDLFAAGWLSAAGSTATVLATAAGRDDEASFVELTASWLAPRRTPPQPEVEPMERFSWTPDVRVSIGPDGVGVSGRGVQEQTKKGEMLL